MGLKINTNVSTEMSTVQECLNFFRWFWRNLDQISSEIVDFLKSHPLQSAVVSSLMIRSGRPDTQMISTRANSFVFGVFGRQEPGYPTLFPARSQRNIQKSRKSQIGGMHHPIIVAAYTIEIRMKIRERGGEVPQN